MHRTIEYNSCLIAVCPDNNMVSLTDMWKAAGSPENKLPRDWLEAVSTAELLAELLFQSNCGQWGQLKSQRPISSRQEQRALECWMHKVKQASGDARLVRTSAGRYGGTFGTQKLAIAYAEYLSPEFHSWALGALVERIEEDADPELGVRRSRDRAIANWKKQGKSDKWIADRLDGVAVRHGLTDALKEHGISQPVEYASCTNEINKPILGGTAKEIKAIRRTKNLRDGLTSVELAAIRLAESLALQTIEENNLHGYKQCRSACSASGNRVKRVFD